MRILRLRLANYRGVGEIDVRFSPQGITLIEGPNEVGKTSLAEAVRLLFEHPDTTGKKEVKAVKPVHIDAGPEIELEAQCGPYSFSYRKRFLKKPETVLRIDRPHPENHTGREAHERADAILRETIDVGLWTALSVYQGEAIHQADLSKQTALSVALDRVAGGPVTRPEEETLFERVTAEYGRYYTSSGAEGQQLKQARERERSVEAQVSAYDQRLKELQADTDRAAVLSEDERTLRKSHGDLEAESSRYRDSLNEIRDLEGAVREKASALESPRADERIAQHEREVRQKLVEAVAAARKNHADLTPRIELLQPRLEQVEHELKRCKAAVSDARARQKEAELLFRLRSADLDYLHDRLDLEQMCERKTRTDEARRKAAEAEEALSSNHVDEETLRKIEDAARRVITAEARLQAGSPSLMVRALTDILFVLDDKDVVLEKDGTLDRSVPDQAALVFPNVAEVKVTAGTSLVDLSAEVERAREDLESACRAADVANSIEAKEAHTEYLEALRVVTQSGDVERQNLRDLTYEDLERRVYGLEKSVPEYQAKRAEEPPLIEDFKLARTTRQESETAFERANAALETAHRELEAGREAHEQMRNEYQRLQIELDQTTISLGDAESNLASARKTTSDEELESCQKKAISAVRAAEEALEAAERALKGKDPERFKILADVTEGSLRTLRTTLQGVQQELMDVRARLKVHGEEGLHELLHEAESKLEQVRQEKEVLFRRAAAAKLLFEIIKEERDAARRAYVVPLKEKIEHLGRLVFNDTFQVGMSDDLAIANRTLDGVTVDFNDLSGGTREQLALISRLACALIVGRDGGVPVILDDALGYTDPERLKLMGAVLSRAARNCQIVILTCYPQRYAHVGDATIVRL